MAGHSSKFKGVTKRGKASWEAQIELGKRKAKYLGAFSSEEDAARAYDAAARTYFGEFAYQNFPEITQPKSSEGD